MTRYPRSLPLHPRAVLLVGNHRTVTDLVLQVLSREWPQRAPIILPRRADAEHYLSASCRAGRSPAAAILGIEDDRTREERVGLLRWMRCQDEGLRRIPVIVVGSPVELVPGLSGAASPLFVGHPDPESLTSALARAIRQHGVAMSDALD